MRIAALVPTRNRAVTAARAIRTFLDALQPLGHLGGLVLAVVDDSDAASEQACLAASVAQLGAEFPEARIDTVPAHAGSSTRSVPDYRGGPGSARNRGLAHLRRVIPRADLTIMFDDDVSFAPTCFRGHLLACDGSRLLAQAVEAGMQPQTIAGCSYLGRQDLSILEHARLAGTRATDARHVAPATDRSGVEDVAPGGITTAFLAIGAGPAELPDFPEHYNEDYVWLHAFAQAGWRLRRVSERLVHAPPGDVSVSADALSFQIYGEIVWLCVLEHERFPVDDHAQMTAAVEEIAGDLRHALADEAVIRRPLVSRMISDVLGIYEAMQREFAKGELGATARHLVHDVRRGLNLRAVATRPSTDVGLDANAFSGHETSASGPVRLAHGGYTPPVLEGDGGRAVSKIDTGADQGDASERRIHEG
jgi:glycosyltransferase involved in cell wall biosynthesis